MQSKRLRLLAALLTALCLLTLALACGRGGGDEDDDEPAGGGEAEAQLQPYAPTGREGSLKGTVAFAGAAPEVKIIPMSADTNCERANPNAKAEDIVINGDKLQNVFVYVKEGRLSEGNKSIANLSFPAGAEPKTLDQHGCMYVPHVIGIQAKQKLSITNSDQTTHNVNVQATKNDKVNPSQPPNTPPIDYVPKRSEVLIPVKCNQHPWMKAYIGVLSHPFYAVSGPDGSFEITGLPPGTYTLVAWHEKMKEQTQQVTIGPGENKAGVAFSFNATTASEQLDGGSLTLMPALELPAVSPGRHH
jgi:hypothetical protein